jgi:ABC-type oligopeptide transport system ATPase subunit
MYRGKIVELESSAQLFANPRHAYTKVLLSAIPSPDPDVRLKPVLKGSLAEEGVG